MKDKTNLLLLLSVFLLQTAFRRNMVMKARSNKGFREKRKRLRLKFSNETPRRAGTAWIEGKQG